MDCNRQALLSMRFSWQEHWSGFPCPPPGGLPDLGIKSEFHVSCIGSRIFFTASATWEAWIYLWLIHVVVEQKQTHCKTIIRQF